MKTELIKYVLGVLLILVCIVSPQAQTLDDYLKEATENNPSLKASYTEFEASLQKVHQMKALPDPNLSISAFGQMIETRLGPQKARISLSQMFPWFGTLKASGDIATLIAEAKYQVFLNDKNELFLKVKQAYYPLVEVEEHLSYQKEYLSLLSSMKDLATTSFANGKSPMVNVIRTEIMINDIKTDIQLLEEIKKPLQVSFNRLLNRDDNLAIVLQPFNSIDKSTLTHQKDSLLAQNPIIQSLNLRIEAAEVNQLLAKKQGMPQLGIGFDYVIIGKRMDANIPNNGKDAFMPMVSMSLPIYRGKYNAMRKEAELMQTALTAQKTATENQLVSEYEMTLYELGKSERFNELYDRQLIQTQQVIELLQTAYSNSGQDFEEILRNQQQLIKFKIAKVTVLKNYFIALAKLDYLLSKSE